MKRPVGFDAPPDRPQVRNPRPAGPRASTTGASVRSSPGRPEAASSSTAAPRIGDAVPPAGSRHTDRLAVRQAARERRRAESAEVRRFTRRSRHRRVVTIVAAGVLVLLVATPIVLAVSPLFAVRSIVVDGANSTLASSVRAALSDQVGTPLALVDANAVHRQMAALPLVASYSTETLPPGTLEVRVVPRIGIAQTHDATGFHQVDAAGVVMRTASGRFAGLPVVVVAAGARDADAAFAAAANVIGAMSPSVLARVRTVRAATRDDVTLTLTTGQRVVWGSADDSAIKAVDLRAALVRAARGVTTIDVSSPGVVSTR